ncbi:MAG: hypothetical protein O2931_12045, partial [Planctomycetota bacterium]|nr:hypothetical protein [Planctomycetota bacterium]
TNKVNNAISSGISLGFFTLHGDSDGDIWLESLDLLAQEIGDRRRTLAVIMENDHYRNAVGDDRLFLLAINQVLHPQARASDGCHSSSDPNPIRVPDLTTVIALQRRQNGSQSLLLHQRIDSAMMQKGDPRRFEPTEEDRIVHMAKRVHVSPQYGQLHHGRPCLHFRG